MLYKDVVYGVSSLEFGQNQHAKPLLCVSKKYLHTTWHHKENEQNIPDKGSQEDRETVKEKFCGSRACHLLQSEREEPQGERFGKPRGEKSRTAQ